MDNELDSNDKEIDPVKRDGTEFTLETRYACKADGKYYYPRDKSGTEYMVQNLNLIENDGNYIYPKTARGRPRYRVENGIRVYETVGGQQIIGVGLDGNQYYATDRLGNEYYPDNNTPAKLADGTPYYASTTDGNLIFPTDVHGNEYYFTFVDLSKPVTIPNRYAVSVSGNEIYPLIQTLENNEAQYLINDKYAVDSNNKPYYPKDGFKNEYYRKPSPLDIVEYRRKWSINNILLDRYALTNDGKIILPTVQNDRFYISPIIEPQITRKNIIGKLIRDGDIVSDCITNVLDPKFKPEYTKPYKYRKSITNEIKLVVPKQPPSIVNFTINTSMPFYRRWCFWAFLMIIILVKSFVLWWFYFKNSLHNSPIII